MALAKIGSAISKTWHLLASHRLMLLAVNRKPARVGISASPRRGMISELWGMAGPMMMKGMARNREPKPSSHQRKARLTGS